MKKELKINLRKMSDRLRRIFDLEIDRKIDREFYKWKEKGKVQSQKVYDRLIESLKVRKNIE